MGTTRRAASKSLIANDGRNQRNAEPLLTAKQVADFLQLSRSSITRLVDVEGLPAFVIFLNPGKRTLRFRESEVEKWLEGRRERQITATLNGARYTRRQT